MCSGPIVFLSNRLVLSHSQDYNSPDLSFCSTGQRFLMFSHSEIFSVLSFKKIIINNLIFHEHNQNRILKSCFGGLKLNCLISSLQARIG